GRQKTRERELCARNRAWAPPPPLPWNNLATKTRELVSNRSRDAKASPDYRIVDGARRCAAFVCSKNCASEPLWQLVRPAKSDVGRNGSAAELRKSLEGNRAHDGRILPVCERRRHRQRKFGKIPGSQQRLRSVYGADHSRDASFAA